MGERAGGNDKGKKKATNDYFNLPELSSCNNEC